MTTMDLNIDDEILSPHESAPSAPKESKPAGSVIQCHYCPETFEGQAGFFRRGRHEKKEHFEEWNAAKDKEPVAKKAAGRVKKATKKATPAAKSPGRPPAVAKPKRVSAADALSSNIARIAKLLGGIDVPLSRALVFSAPATGQAVDELVAGTVVDRLVVQRVATVSDKWERLGGVIAFPILVAVISKNNALFPVLEDELREATMDVLIANIPTMEKKKARERKVFDSLHRLGEVDDRFKNSSDPIGLILADLFNIEVEPDDSGAEAGRHAANQ